jgi:hypothetical protein
MAVHKETYAELSVQSDILTSEQVTSILGIPCDKGWVKGTPVPPRNVARHPHHGWNIRTFLSKEATLEDHIADLAERLAPMKEKVKQVSNEADVLFCCVIYTTEAERPALVFDRKVIAAIADMGAGFWIDMYLFPEDAFLERCREAIRTLKGRIRRVFIRRHTVTASDAMGKETQ